jgi:hypothetical protein
MHRSPALFKVHVVHISSKEASTTNRQLALTCCSSFLQAVWLAVLAAAGVALLAALPVEAIRSAPPRSPDKQHDKQPATSPKVLGSAFFSKVSSPPQPSWLFASQACA